MGEVLRGQYPSRYAATLNKSQSQPTVATTITINSTVRLKRMRMRYARVPKTQTFPQAGIVALKQKDRPKAGSGFQMARSATYIANQRERAFPSSE